MRFPALPREPAAPEPPRGRRPLRVFLADTSGDVDNQFGNWPLANQQMDAALILVVRGEPNQIEWFCLDAERSLNHVGVL